VSDVFALKEYLEVSKRERSEKSEKRRRNTKLKALKVF
jgi:hypothetical protein